MQAAKGGNENEVGRLLQDLKQNRKRKVRKVKIRKLGLTSTPLHSPDYGMADDYYCPQQQPPYQWVSWFSFSFDVVMYIQTWKNSNYFIKSHIRLKNWSMMLETENYIEYD